MKNIFRNFISGCLILALSSGISTGADAVVALPAGIPTKLLVGLFEQPGETWMKNSEVPWNARYCYLTKDWVDNWGWGERDGWFARNYMKECDELGAMPAIAYYQINGEPGGGEDQFYAKTKVNATMKSYFEDFKILMQRAKEFGKPVYILLEADGFGYLEMQSSNNPDAPAAVASTGMPELAGLPNTIAGWGQAFLAIKKAVGASNALLGLHISGWASEQDLFYYSVTIPLQPEIDKVYRFLAPLGLAANPTGLTYDVLVGDPLDRDADFYRLVSGDDGVHWWDTSAVASINSRSFNRYREWLRLWSAKSGKRWVLWQIPLGNSNHLNVNNTGKPREGYKDNRPEYFLGTGGMQRTRQFVDAGVIALLFGAGASGVSSYENDLYTDGALFMQSRAAAFFAAGGISIEAGAVSRPYNHAWSNSLAIHTGKVEMFDISGRIVSRLSVANGCFMVTTPTVSFRNPVPVLKLR